MRHRLLPALFALTVPPLAAQEQLLHPDAQHEVWLGSPVMQLDLRPLAANGAASGRPAVRALQEYQPLLRALLAASGRHFDEQSSLLHVLSPQAPHLDGIASADLCRLTVAESTAIPGVTARVLDFRPERPDRAAAIFDAAIAELRSAGAELVEDAPWPDSRRVRARAGNAWIARKGRQLVLATGEPPLALRGDEDRGGGVRLEMQVPMTPPNETARKRRLDRAFTDLLGLPESARAFFQLRIDGDGCCEQLVCRGELVRPLQVRPLAAAPKLPRLEGQLLLMRANVDPGLFAGLLDLYAVDYLGGVDLQPYRDLLAQAAFGLALGIAAPPPGSLLPRIALAMRIRDGDAVLALLRRHAADGRSPRVELRHEGGVEFGVVPIAGAPPTLRPTLCVCGDVLLLCDSPSTLQLVRAGSNSTEDVFADATAPACAAPAGAALLGECWFDCEAISRQTAKSWNLRLVANLLQPLLVGPNVRVEPLLSRDELPDLDVLAPILGRGRAVFYATADEIGMRVRAPVLGPLLTAAVTSSLDLLPELLPAMLESMQRKLRARATEARARRLGEALRRFRAEHDGALPGAIGDLVQLLPPGDHEPLRAPHDPLAQQQPAVFADGRRVQMPCSFQLAPAGMLASQAIAAMPGTLPMPGQRPDRRPRPAFAFCGAGYLGHHLVILTEGDVIWIRSQDLLAALPGGR